jgi:hypothetical protein
MMSISRRTVSVSAPPGQALPPGARFTVWTRDPEVGYGEANCVAGEIEGALRLPVHGHVSFDAGCRRDSSIRRLGARWDSAVHASRGFSGAGE